MDPRLRAAQLASKRKKEEAARARLLEKQAAILKRHTSAQHIRGHGIYEGIAHSPGATAVTEDAQ